MPLTLATTILLPTSATTIYKYLILSGISVCLSFCDWLITP